MRVGRGFPLPLFSFLSLSSILGSSKYVVDFRKVLR